MINLLPPPIKSSYDYARRNVTLSHWIIAFLIALLGLLAIGTTGLIYMQHLADTYAAEINSSQNSLKLQKLAQTQTKAQDISNSLKLAVQVLSQEVLFSKLLQQLATVTPSNASLSSLTIGQTTGALDITAQTTNYAAATQLQANLTDPANRIFSKADLVSVTCGGTTQAATNTKYPCTVTIRALFAEHNPFLFINNGAKS